MALKLKPAVLIILDGFGITTPNDSNAISLSHKPYLDKITGDFPTMLLEASGMNVGLPWGEVGNSEVGHVNIGSGVLHYQSLPRIDKSIEDQSFFSNPALISAIEKVIKSKSKLHLLGLIGNGGVHAHQRHLEALLNLCKKNKLKKQTFLHLFLDGRDATKDSGAQFLKDTLKTMKKLRCGQLASVCGRFFAMDRNQYWERTQKAYEAIALGRSEKSSHDAVKDIESAYSQQIFDEQFPPMVMVDKKNQPLAPIDRQDAVIFFNFRADRAAQLTEAFVEPNFDKFGRDLIDGLTFITMTEYKKGLPVHVAFPRQIVSNPLAKIISDAGLSQLHIAETEKYAHVTYFLNGQREEKFPGEDRILIPSPLTDSYDKTPGMSADKVTDEIINDLKAEKHDFIIVNYANPDMVGHTGNLEATIKAVEVMDYNLGRLIPEILKKGGSAFLVGDHGNAEELVNLQTGKTDKEHSVYPVPFIIINKQRQGQAITTDNRDLSLMSPLGILSDVAPTILTEIGMPTAKEMTGASLL
ncbi:MAG: 2,3-bisphosphoglycerate-independent phosphoglycerate mutase [Patescibacteria group bacterium]